MKQQIIQIKAADLLDRVERLREEGCRMVQICCTRAPEGFELSYSFDRDYHMYHLRLTVGENESVSSITSLYWPAFIYENEMRDLFGVQIRHIARDVDYGGKFFRLAEKTPWFAPTSPAPRPRPQPRQTAKPAAPEGGAARAGAETSGGAENG